MGVEGATAATGPRWQEVTSRLLYLDNGSRPPTTQCRGVVEAGHTITVETVDTNTTGTNCTVLQTPLYSYVLLNKTEVSTHSSQRHLMDKDELPSFIAARPLKRPINSPFFCCFNVGFHGDAN